jgi:hypothetical protein
MEHSAEGLASDIELTAGTDARHCPLASKNGTLRAGPVYAIAMQAREDPSCPFYKFVWQNHAPPRVCFFGWLLVQKRIQCKATLAAKNTMDTATCELCNCAEETPDHPILHCSVAAHLRASVGVDIPPPASVSGLWELTRSDHLHAKFFHTYLLLCSW